MQNQDLLKTKILLINGKGPNEGDFSKQTIGETFLAAAKTAKMAL